MKIHAAVCKWGIVVLAAINCPSPTQASDHRWRGVTPKRAEGAAREVAPMQLRAIPSLTTDSEERGNEADKAVDGNPATFWHTAWKTRPKPYPHYLRMKFPSEKQIRGFTVLPRQDGNRTGWICDYAFYVSDDGTTWGSPIKRGSFEAKKDLQSVLFSKPVRGRFFMFAALSSFVSAHASMAEFSLLETKGDSSGTRTGISGEESESEIVVDGDSPGLVFDGVGAVSAGGSTRLLIDYPEPERSRILDYLFKPNYGAALQLLKVEIGADTDATCGAEPSHQRTPGQIQCDLGYEWWLMKQAKKRNPEIKLCGLAWGTPGWIHGGFWSDDNIRYTIAWLDCAKMNGLHIDYLGGGNERGWNAEYYIKLRRALNENGFAHIKLIASDDHRPPDYWAVAKEMKTNVAFASAVDILGQHDVCVWRTQQRHCYVSADATALNKPLWDSENSTQDYKTGCDPLARAMNRHYIEGRITGNLNWSLVGAYYGSFPAPGTGLVLADRPWSGWFSVGKSVWVDAHTTQFTKPGWRYLNSACGYTSGGASYVALCSPDSNAFSIIIETLDLESPGFVRIRISDNLPHKNLTLWKTDLRSDNASDYFVKAGKLSSEDGKFRVRLAPGFLYTISTLTGQHKGGAQPRGKSSERMPLPFSEDFENAGADRLARFFSDVHGGFQVAPSAGGRQGCAYRQMIEEEPILWHGAKMPPTTIVGDPLWWGDYEVSVDALLEGSGFVELLGRIEGQQHNVKGYHFQVCDSGAWEVYAQHGKQDIQSSGASSENRTLARGTNQAFGLREWHRLALRFAGKKVTALLDNRELAQVEDQSFASGQAGLRVSAWQHAQFDNFKIVKTRPWPKFVPHSEMKATATSEHEENDFGSIYIANHAVDDRLETSWRSEYLPPAPFPQSITLDLKRDRSTCGLTYRPPMDRNTVPPITSYSVYASSNGREFFRIASGTWNRDSSMKTARWPALRARYIRLEATEGDPGWGTTAAEIEIATTQLPSD